ncbi:hypothetical protein [Methylobacterium sp. JK268]
MANDVLSQSGSAFAPCLRLQRGEIFAQTRAGCHGEQGRGRPDLGAPNRTDAAWLCGSAPRTVAATITDGRRGVKPTGEGRRDAVPIKSPAIDLHGLGGELLARRAIPLGG